MQIENMPFCCTSAIIGMFGEHGEQSFVSVEEVKRLIATKRNEVRDSETGELLANGKRCVFAISVDPKNIRILRTAGFHIVDHYEGVQGRVYILTFHV